MRPLAHARRSRPGPKASWSRKLIRQPSAPIERPYPIGKFVGAKGAPRKRRGSKRRAIGLRRPGIGLSRRRHRSNCPALGRATGRRWALATSRPNADHTENSKAGELPGASLSPCCPPRPAPLWAADALIAGAIVRLLPRSCFPCPAPRKAPNSIGRRAPDQGELSLFLPGNREKKRGPVRFPASSREEKICFSSILKQTPEPVNRQSNVEITGKTPACSEPEQDVPGRPERAPPRRARDQLRLDVDKQDEGRIFEDAST